MYNTNVRNTNFSDEQIFVKTKIRFSQAKDRGRSLRIYSSKTQLSL